MYCYRKVTDDLYWVGANDRRLALFENIHPLYHGVSYNAYVLMVDHAPYVTQDIIDSGADLQLSGHAHAGQLFPLQGVYRLAGYDAYGFFRHGDTDLYVSAGASGWSFPFRTEAGCHYEVITLE